MNISVLIMALTPNKHLEILSFYAQITEAAFPDNKKSLPPEELPMAMMSNRPTIHIKHSS